MTRFTFSLERVLAVRRAQASVELGQLEQLRSQLAALSRERADLAGSVLTSGREVAEAGARHLAGHLRSVENFAGFARQQDARFAEWIEHKRREIEDQQWRVQQAEQSCRLLEKLEERQRADWERAAGHELEELAADSYLAQWSRRSRAG